MNARRAKLIDEEDVIIFWVVADTRAAQYAEPECLCRSMEITPPGLVVTDTDRGTTLYPWARVLWVDDLGD